jgi:adenylate kinase family enzyme
MKKILVIGSGGSGKSTLARQLGELLDIEVKHLDRLYWQPGWTEPSKEEWLNKVKEVANDDSSTFECSVATRSFFLICRGSYVSGG